MGVLSLSLPPSFQEFEQLIIVEDDQIDGCEQNRRHETKTSRTSRFKSFFGWVTAMREQTPSPARSSRLCGLCCLLVSPDIARHAFHRARHFRYDSFSVKQRG
jgi:hypothetical protein